MSSLILPAHARAPIRDALADLGRMVNFEVGVGGFYRIWKKRPGQPRKLVRDWFCNLLLDAGLDRYMGSIGGFASYAYIGAGNTPPAVGNTNMESLLGVSSGGPSTTSGRINESPYYAYDRKTFTFPAGTGTGNIAEVGVGWSGTTPSGSLFSRALIVDAEGSPTTIAKLADEQLDVEYEFRVYPPLSDVTGTVSGYGYTLRAANLGVSGGTSGNWTASANGGTANTFRAYTGVIGANTGIPAGTVYNTAPSTNGVLAYTNGTFFRDHQWTYSASQANLSGGIKSLSWGHGPAVMQIEFGAAIDKTATRTVRFTSRLTLARKSLPL